MDKWTAAAEQHSKSLENYINLARRMSKVQWSSPVADGKWTPIEITEHLRAAYELLIREQESGVGLRPRAGWAFRTFLRYAILPGIMRKRKLPAGAKSPRELVPSNCIEDRDEALLQLHQMGTKCADVLVAGRDDPKAKMTHHLFGDFDTATGLEFVTIHLENHTRQLPVNNG
jgi:hypothetical protein